MDKLIIKGRLENKSSVLEKPEFYNDVTMLIFIVSEEYKASLINYYKNNGIKDYQELTIAPWPIGKTERAIKLFFALRDRIAEQQGDSSRENKDNLYRSAVKELGLIKKGKLIRSIKDLDKQGLFMATGVLHDWALEAGCYLADLIPEIKASQKGLKE